ncbi:MAG: hypothetical protein ABI758_00360 [Candidatus Woesebacteria bacterium]
MSEKPTFLSRFRSPPEAVFLDGDPRRLSHLISESTTEFLKRFELLSEKQKKHYVQRRFLTPKVSDQNDRAKQPESFRIKFYQPEVLEKVLPYMTGKLDDFHEVMMMDFFEREIGINFKSVDGTSIRLIPDEALNAPTAWFTDNAYGNMQDISVLLKSLPADDANAYAEDLVALGIAYGYLSPNHPDARASRKVLAPYITKNSPRLLREYTTDLENQASLGKPIEKLKGFWHKAFVNEWVATSRLDYDGIAALTIRDRMIAQSSLSTDNRSSEGSSGAARQAEQVYDRYGSIDMYHNVISEHQRQQHKMEIDARLAHNELQTYTNELLGQYHPGRESTIYDKQGKLVGDWAVFAQKSGRLFEVFTKLGHALSKPNLSIQEQQEILHPLSRALLDVLEAGDGQNSLSVRELFGPSFPSLSSLEQTALIIFTALSIAGRKGKPRLAVEFISNTFQNVLQHAQGTSEDTTLPHRDMPAFDLAKYTKESETAQAFLVSVPMEKELTSTKNPEVLKMLQEREAEIKEFEVFMKEMRPELIKLTRSLTPVGYLLATMLYTAASISGIYGQLFFELSGASSPTTDLASTSFATGVTVALLLSTNYYLPRTVMNLRLGLRNDLLTQSILDPKYTEFVESLQKKAKKSRIKHKEPSLELCCLCL